MQAKRIIVLGVRTWDYIDKQGVLKQGAQVVYTTGDPTSEQGAKGVDAIESRYPLDLARNLVAPAVYEASFDIIQTRDSRGNQVPTLQLGVLGFVQALDLAAVCSSAKSAMERNTANGAPVRP